MQSEGSTKIRENIPYTGLFKNVTGNLAMKLYLKGGTLTYLFLTQILRKKPTKI